MNLRHAVDVMAADDRQVRHPDPPPAAFVHDRHPLHAFDVARIEVAHLLEEPVVDLVDDLQVAREDPLEEAHRPGLQRLRHQGVVRVCEGPPGDVPRPVPLEVVDVEQQAHQLGNGDGRMRVVQLNRHVIGECIEGVVRVEEPLDDVLERGGDEEILLLQAQLASDLGRVVRVQDLRQVLGLGLLLDRLEVVAFVEVLEVEVARRLRRPEAHAVHRPGVVSGHRRIARHGEHRVGVHPVGPEMPELVDELHDAAAEAHRKEHLRPRHLPGIAVAQPRVRMLDLGAAFNRLEEDAVLVADAVPEPGQRQRRHRIEDAGRKPAEAAVAERGILLDRPDLVELHFEIDQRRAALVVQSDVQQAVREQPAGQELHRQVVHPFGIPLLVAARRLHPAFDQPVTDGERRGVKPVARRGRDRILAK